MKKRRIFLAINLPEEIKKNLVNFQEEWSGLPVRWTKPENLHITLVFLGYVSDEDLLEVIQSVKKIVQKHQIFNIELKRICFGPPHRPPRMIWAEGEKNMVLSRLKNDLEEELSGRKGYQGEQKGFHPHITLARIKQWQDLPRNIEKEISLSFSVDSINIMESILSSKGPNYFVLESNALK